MEQSGIPTPLMTKADLKGWLQVSDFWVRDRMETDPDFVRLCVIDLAQSGSSRRTIRFNVRAVEEYLGISTASAPVPAAA
ncbi:hypothetical protein OG978_32340 [Streptomyces sp. NBC_01591]|uniref:hypothetical protein n=1 Tax=Streptomyces sp. NBC_01591 TaxID=2975888 RepID=UPI002DD84E92|nr:hypothetical protein [Streptomyces sp. NBC_01591]WSD71663.1 hypothetical protein OG978_32340 [Streptomyces sp. NBC_01591]